MVKKMATMVVLVLALGLVGCDGKVDQSAESGTIVKVHKKKRGEVRQMTVDPKRGDPYTREHITGCDKGDTYIIKLSVVVCDDGS